LESEGKMTIDGIGIQKMKLPREYAKICVNQDIVGMLSLWKLKMD